MALVVKSIGTAARDYSTITLWEADLDNGAIYSAADDAQGECYNDTVFDEGVAINGGGTIGLNSITLTVPVAERHDGTAGTGARITNSTTSGAINVLVLNHSTIPITAKWLEVGNISSGSGNISLIVTTGANNLHTVSNMVLHDITHTGQWWTSSAGIKGTRWSTIFNTIVYNIFQPITGGDGRLSCVGISNVSTGSGIIKNTTIFNVVADAALTARGCSSGTYTNVLVADSSVVDFMNPNVASNYNLSSDASANGANSLVNKTSTNQFVSNTSPYDLHLKAGADAIDAGVDLLTTPAGVNIDIDGRDRDAQGDMWDMGADEFVSVGGGTSWKKYEQQRRNRRTMRPVF